jgi:hypothetical protein
VPSESVIVNPVGGELRVTFLPAGTVICQTALGALCSPLPYLIY